MMVSGLLLVALLACLTIMVLMSVWRQRQFWGKLPPGPPALPFIGNYLQLNTEQICNSLMKISERYGPVFTVYLGRRPVVVLCGYEAVKEALLDQAEEFSGRGMQATFDWISKDYGVVFSSGERAKQLRRFSIATLRDFGMGKRGIHERIQEEAGFLIEALRGTQGAFIDPTFFLSRTVSNVISSIVFGDRFDYEDKEFLSMLSMMLGSFQFTATPTGQSLLKTSFLIWATQQLCRNPRQVPNIQAPIPKYLN
ncbi:cytochrome P450 2A13 isoform 2-T2 [Rhynchonycteris naso]